MDHWWRVLFYLGLILVPNGKWLGKQLGDRYPTEEALEAAKKNRRLTASLDFDGGGQNFEPDGLPSSDAEIEDYYDQWEEEYDTPLPGGRLYGMGQDNDEMKMLKKMRERKVF